MSKTTVILNLLLKTDSERLCSFHESSQWAQ